jgi:hypothetical protein
MPSKKYTPHHASPIDPMTSFEPLPVLSIPYFERHLGLTDRHRFFEDQYHTSTDTLLQELDGRKDYALDGWRVKVMESFRRRMDSKRFALEYPEAYDRYVVVSHVRQLLIIAPTDPF